MSDNLMCLIDGCETEERNGGIMCAAHWRRVPADLREDIYTAAARWSKWNDTYEKYEKQSREKVVPKTITALAQEVTNAYSAWEELRDTAIGEVELQEVEAAKK